MAITYLSGERIQGLAGAEIAATSTADFINDNPSGSASTDSLGGNAAGDRDYLGVEVSSSHPAIGKAFSSYTFWCWKDQSPTDVIGLRIFDSSGNLKGTGIQASVTQHAASGIAGSADGTSLTWVAPVDTNDATGYVTIASGDRIVLWDVNDSFASGAGQVQVHAEIGSITGNLFIRYNSGSTNAWSAAAAGNGSAKWKATRVTALVPAVNEKATITNAPIGTRYEETDTRKIFRRKAGGGAAQITNIFNTSNATWTDNGQGSGVNGAAITTGDDPTGKIYLSQGSGSSGKNEAAYSTAFTGTGQTSSSKTFIIDFTWIRHVGDKANTNSFMVGSTYWNDDNPAGDEKKIEFQMVNGDYCNLRLATAASTVATTSGNRIAMQGCTSCTESTETTRYYKIVGNGTNCIIHRWTSAALRTAWGTPAEASNTPESSSSAISFPSDWLTTDDINIVSMGGASGYHQGQWTVKEVSIKWDSGVADSWVEKGTA